ncbi:MAG: nucleotide exchange factor GrpE [bacterium]|nr:nucleotide exchange factor GrpE [bacterium]
MSEESKEEMETESKSAEANSDMDSPEGSAENATGEEAELEAKEKVEEEPELSTEDQLTLERDVFHDKWMRAVAETDNVRKRSRREVNDARRFAQAETLRAFLDVYDNFERALQAVSQDDEKKEKGSLREGVELIFQKFQAALKDRGAVLIDSVECEFDPAVHEAVGQLPREGVEAGMVIEVAQQGFKYGDMVLRPARVIVSS